MAYSQKSLLITVDYELGTMAVCRMGFIYLKASVKTFIVVANIFEKEAGLAPLISKKKQKLAQILIWASLVSIDIQVHDKNQKPKFCRPEHSEGPLAG